MAQSTHPKILQKTLPRTWQIVDAPFNPGKMYHLETIFTIGNGNMGIRGTFEEGYPNEIASTLVHGIFDHHPSELVPDLVNLPNPLPIVIEIDGERFSMTSGRILGYRRVLDLQNGTLTRGVLWRCPAGVDVQITFERFAALDTESLLAQKVTVRPLTRGAKVVITASIDGTVKNFEGADHWGEIRAVQNGDFIEVHGITAQSGYGVSVISGVVTDVPTTVDTSKNLQPAIRAEYALEKEQAATFIKYTALESTRKNDAPSMAASHTVRRAIERGWDDLLRAQTEEWAKYWYNSDIVIDGDEVATRALRFCTYHVLIATPRNDERVSIGAKTLSGPGYKGHVFWDTELFMVPLLTLTQPHLARNLLMYRYHNLQGARNKAKEAGYAGAMFPWESTDTGEETTPRWTHPDSTGQRIRIWTGDNEQHISTDITYAVLQYWQWTGDDEFFTNYGAEIVLDTAVFWASRVEYNATADQYELSQQIGPDEYHENVDNSVFTNSMVRWHLREAMRVREWLRANAPDSAQRLDSALGINDEHVQKWGEIADKMYIPFSEEHRVLEQFEGFMKLQPIDLSHWKPRVSNMDWILGHGPTQGIMVIKQADVVMLMALLGEKVGTPEELRRNWDFYYPIVDHGSSLSPAMHAWVAARLGLMHEAYDMFIHAATIDLEDNKGNVRDGIHAAAAGGLWQSIVFGFAGVQVKNGELTVDPKFPDHWRSVRFRVWVRGEQKEIHIGAE